MSLSPDFCIDMKRYAGGTFRDYDGQFIIVSTEGGSLFLKNVTFHVNTLSGEDAHLAGPHVDPASIADPSASGQVFSQAHACSDEFLVDTVVRMEGCRFVPDNRTTAMPPLMQQTYYNITARVFTDLADVAGWRVEYPGMCEPTRRSDLAPFHREQLNQQPAFPRVPAEDDQWLLDTHQVLAHLTVSIQRVAKHCSVLPLD